MDLYEELRDAAKVLESAGVSYAVCGGIAVAVYGHVRATKDIDFLISPDELDAAHEALSKIGYVHSSSELPFHASDGTVRRIHRVTKVSDSDHLTIDLLLAETDPWSTALSTRERKELDSFSIDVVSREGLIGMKRESTRLLDRDDIERLSADE